MAEPSYIPGLVSIVEAFGDTVWVRDAKTRELLYVSPNSAALIGWPEGKPYTSNSFLEAVEPEDRARVLAVFESVQDVFSVEFRIRRREEVRWIYTRGRFVRGDDGARVRLEGCNTDVTERVLREEEMRAQKRRAERLSDLAERLSTISRLDEAMHAVCDATANALEVPSIVLNLYDPETHAAAAEYGHGLPHARGPVTPPYEVLAAGIARYGRVAQFGDMLENPDYHFAERIRAHDLRSMAYAALVRGDEVLGALSVLSYGELRRFSEGELALLRGIADQAVGALLRARLSTEKERAEASLRESERRYREIVETTHDGICVLDLDGRFVFANAPIARILDAPRDRLLGTTMLEHLSPEDGEWTKEQFAKRRQGDGARLDSRIHTRSGKEVWVSTSASTVFDGAQAKGVLLVVSDITEARKLDEKIQHAQKLESLGVLAGGVAHDFNNLLVSMLGNAGVALTKLPPDDELREIVGDIRTAALRASELTKQLLAYSGRGRFVVTRFDVGKLVAEMGHLLTSVIPKNVRISYAFAPGLPPVEADPTQVGQIAMNLITNAADAIGERGGAIRVATRAVDADAAYLAGCYLDLDLKPGRYVCLEVADDGCGMSAETRAKIFDPFFTTKFTGRGLGLASVLGILRAHGGAIRVDSEVGRGTTFRVLFPAAAGVSVAVPREPEAAPLAWRGHGALLVVDDEERVLAVMRRVLSGAGFEVVTAADGVSALETFRAHRERLRAVVLDVTMPRMGGEQTLRALREIDPGVRILLCSGYDEQEATLRFSAEGRAAFLAKPFEPRELVDAVRRVLGE